MIVRQRSPFAGVSALDRSFDRAFEQLTSSFFEPRRRGPLMEATWSEGSLQLTVDLPGVPAEAVSLDVAGRSLTVGVQTDDFEWSRTLELGAALDPEAVTARHVDGRLTVTVNAVQAPTPRSIAIDTAAQQPAIETSATSGEDGESGDVADHADDAAQSTDTMSNG